MERRREWSALDYDKLVDERAAKQELTEQLLDHQNG